MLSFVRFLVRNKLYSLINFVGLTVSLGFVIIIFGYSVTQERIARSVPHCDRVYDVMCMEQTLLYYGAHEKLEAMPEVELVTSFRGVQNNQIIRYGSQPYSTAILEVDTNFFRMMSVRLQSGNPEEFVRLDAAILSERYARRLFGGEDPLGKSVIYGDIPLTVIGTVSDFGKGIIPYCDMIIKMDSNPVTKRTKETDRFTYFSPLVTLARVVQGTDEASFEENLISSLNENPYLQKQTSILRADKIYFHPGNFVLNRGDINLLRSLRNAGIVLLILALAGYINLNTALTGKRANEMATRCLLGSSRRDIILRYLGESGIFTLLCFIAALILAVIFIPTLNALISTDENTMLHIADLFRPLNLAVYALVCIAVSTVAGIVPAVIASRISPLATVKGGTGRRNRRILSRMFIILQNVISITLIALSVTMELQYRHLLNRPVGLTLDDIYYVAPHYNLKTNTQVLRHRLESLPCVETVGLLAGSVPSMVNHLQRYSPDGDPTHTVMISNTYCDSTALQLLGYKVLSRYGEDTRNGMWVSRRTFDLLSKNPDIAEDREFVSGIYRNGAVITAVIDNFLVSGVNTSNDIGAVIFTGLHEHIPNFIIKTTGSREEARRAINDLIREFSIEETGTELESYHSDFLTDIIARGAHKAHQNMKLIEIFMIICVILSLSGLVAISIHIISSSVRNIALHKIFGANTSQETMRNLASYFLSTLIANAIALPISIFLCRRYLEDFGYRISLSPWIFVATVAISLLLTFVSVVCQVHSAASTNPAKALKAE